MYIKQAAVGMLCAGLAACAPDRYDYRNLDFGANVVDILSRVDVSSGQLSKNGTDGNAANCPTPDKLMPGLEFDSKKATTTVHCEYQYKVDVDALKIGGQVVKGIQFGATGRGVNNIDGICSSNKIGILVGFADKDMNCEFLLQSDLYSQMKTPTVVINEVALTNKLCFSLDVYSMPPTNCIVPPWSIYTFKVVL